MKKILGAALALALAAAGAWFLFGPSAKAEPETRYVTAVVEKGSLIAEITSSGTMKPLVEVLVGSQVSGTIKHIYADFETPVTKGMLIALIDPDMFKTKTDQARADLEAARAASAKAKVTAEDELRNFKRKEQLIEKTSISQSDFDTQKMKYDAAAAQMLVEQARVNQMAAKLEEMELQLRYTKIIAPVDGVVTSRSMDVGQTVTAGFQTPVLFKIAEDLTRMQVHTNVDEADIGRVKVGQTAKFSTPAFPEETFEARVNQIRNDPKVEQNVVTYNVVLDVDNNDLKLRPGMTANVRVLLSEVKDALLVPDQALRFTPKGKAQEETTVTPLKSGERRVWKLDGKKLLPVTVRIGVVGTERTQVITDQLKPGDKLVLEQTTSKGQENKPTALRFRF